MLELWKSITNMHFKTINKIVLSSALAITTLSSNQTKSQELTAKQLQICIDKAEEVKRINISIEKIQEHDTQFFKEIESFKLSLVAIDKYINTYHKIRTRLLSLVLKLTKTQKQYLKLLDYKSELSHHYYLK